MKKKNNTGKKWLFAITIIIVTLMIGSTLMIGLDNTRSNSLKYNDHQFTFKNYQWTTIINNYELSFKHHPSELDYINITNPENLNSPLIYLTSHPNETSGYFDISRLKLDLTGQLTQTYFSPGYTEISEDSFLPLVTCQNATPFTPVILYQKSNQTSITYKNNCYILNAKTDIDYLMLTERIIYQRLGVING